MAGMILRKTGVVLLTILKGLLHAVLMILKLLCMCSIVIGHKKRIRGMRKAG